MRLLQRLSSLLFRRKNAPTARGRRIGPRGEDAAVEFLRKLGYKILSRGYSTKFGEIDIIARDGKTIVFIEVKTRRSRRAGGPESAVTQEKQRRITQTALEFLARRKMLDRPTRFDVVSVVWPADQPPEITHFIGAFQAVGTGGFFS